MTSSYMQSGESFQLFGKVIEVLWTNPRVADLVVSEKKNWRHELSNAADISVGDLNKVIACMGIEHLKEMAENNPVGDCVPALLLEDFSFQFGAKTNTCGTCACATNSCGTCFCQTNTCGSCLCINPPGMNL